MEEIWKEVPGYEGHYEASNFGRIKSVKRKKQTILKQNKDLFGYLCVHFCVNSNVKIKRVHIVIAETFLNHKPNGHKGMVVDHIDNNRTNNNLTNLQVITKRHNSSKDKTNKTSRFTGVTWIESRKKWMSSITINNKTKFLGYYTDEIEASNAYQNKLKEL